MHRRESKKDLPSGRGNIGWQYYISQTAMTSQAITLWRRMKRATAVSQVYVLWNTHLAMQIGRKGGENDSSKWFFIRVAPWITFYYVYGLDSIVKYVEPAQN
jgi:hypothetical protein